jgi:hypothetical protein
VEDDTPTKPRLVNHAHAAAVPISALTAWQGLFDHARLASWFRARPGASACGPLPMPALVRHAAERNRVLATAIFFNPGMVPEITDDQGRLVWGRIRRAGRFC